MDKPMSDFHFKFMCFLFKIRDCLFSRKKIIEEIRIKPKYKILDYGAGSGSYIIVAAEKLGEEGLVYALDIHPLSLELITKKAAKKGIKNIKTILSDCKTGLNDNSLDIAFMHDIYHDLTEPNEILVELHRVLKPDGILSFNDHHIKGNKAVNELEKNGLFKLVRKSRKICLFAIVK